MFFFQTKKAWSRYELHIKKTVCALICRYDVCSNLKLGAYFLDFACTTSAESYWFILALWAISICLICVLITTYEFILERDGNESRQHEYGTAGGLQAELRAPNTQSTHIYTQRTISSYPTCAPWKHNTAFRHAHPPYILIQHAIIIILASIDRQVSPFAD